MRIAQIIDSLEIGGAEKMAVNYANALSKKIEFSGLIATRAEGNLKNQLNKEVSYLFLNRKKIIDIAAILKVRTYCKENKIDYLQAHSSSYLIAVLVKISFPTIKLIWHDHNGLSEFLGKRKTYAVKFASIFFNGVIAVNYQLKNWAERYLFCEKVTYLSNFTKFHENITQETNLKGKTGKRILCLANLRHQKNHFFLLEVAEKLKEIKTDWTFHLVGKDFKDDYSAQIKRLLKSKKLEETVFIYGSKNDVTYIINQSDIAILTSQSEGLPVAMIEYGLMKKPVISTMVGEIPLIIEDGVNGFLVEVQDTDGFLEKVIKLIDDTTLRVSFGYNLNQTIVENHSEEGVIVKYLNWIENL